MLERYADIPNSQASSITDAGGRVVTKTVPSGGTIGFTYDALNRVVTKIPAGEAAGTVSLGYDRTGLLLTANDASSASAFTIAYDTAGRPVSRTDQNARTWARSNDNEHTLSQKYVIWSGNFH